MFRKLAEAFRPRSNVAVKQPDPRIHVEGLGTFFIDGKKYVSHGQPGCPRNACIEYFKGRNYIRCGFCYTPLTQEAAIHVLEHADMTDTNGFIWTE